MASLGTDAIVSIWDAQLQPVRQVSSTDEASWCAPASQQVSKRPV